jgi:hypothetical protein
MDIILEKNIPLEIGIKNVLDKLCLVLFDSSFKNLGKTIIIKNKEIKIIKIFLTIHFSIDFIHRYPKLAFWYKQIRNIASIAKEEGIDILIIIEN